LPTKVRGAAYAKQGAHHTYSPQEVEMGNAIDVCKAYFEASWANPPASLLEAGMTYLSDDFKTYDKNGNAEMNREAYVGMGHLLATSFKDFKAVYGEMREEGDTAIVTFHFEGVFDKDLDMSAMGLGIIPATGKKIVWPDDTAVFKAQGDKIVSIKPYGDSGGIENFLAALGIKMPAG
jgi:hypothetical protein